jgi:hypothetical protein
MEIMLLGWCDVCIGQISTSWVRSNYHHTGATTRYASELIGEERLHWLSTWSTIECKIVIAI